jgi:6-methylsalicylate decarboxylase
MTRIDMHGHFEPPEYTAAVLKAIGPAPVPAWTVDQQLEMMAQYAIDATVVSVPPPGVFLGDQIQANELARAVNESYAALTRAYPNRYAALAALPLPDVDAAIFELNYALDVLGLDGVALFTHTAGKYLGDSSLDALMAELDRRGCYVFVHPTMSLYANPLPNIPIWVQEFPFETTRAITNLLYSGTLHRYPNIKFQFAHLGGAAPFLSHRIASLVKRSPPHLGLNDRVPDGPLEYLKRLYFDTGLSNHAPGIAATLEITTLEHIVFGTDWPYAVMPASGDPAPDLAYLGEGRARVDSQNAAVLVPRLIERMTNKQTNSSKESA